MKLVRFIKSGQPATGVVDDSGLVRDASALLADVGPSTLGDDDWRAKLAGLDVASLPAVGPQTDVPVEPIIAGVGKIVCLGLNDKQHAEQLGMTGDIKPLIFIKPQSAITSGHGPVVYPKNGKKMDWETELLVVIGKQCKYVPKDRALDVVFGYAIHNDLSDRYWQTDQKGGLTALTSGKSFDTFAPMGPLLVTKDEIPDPGSLRVTLSVNGEQRQDFSTADYIYDVAATIEYCSQFFTLFPGDVISMGSGPGNGAEWGRYLQVGDRLTCSIEGLGEQNFLIEAEQI